MATVKGLFERGGNWWFGRTCPNRYRPSWATNSLQRTLETSDIKIALLKFPAVMTEFEVTLTKAGTS